MLRLGGVRRSLFEFLATVLVRECSHELTAEVSLRFLGVLRVLGVEYVRVVDVSTWRGGRAAA